MVVVAASPRDHRSVILRATPEMAAVTLRNIEIVIHRNREAFAAIRPGHTSVVADVHAAIVNGIDLSRCGRRHQELMMIGMRVFRLAGLRVPSRHLLPVLAAVGRQMEIDTAAQDMIRILRMNGDGVSVRNLSFIREMFAPNFSPAFSAIVASENTEQQIAPVAVRIFRESIHHVGIRQADCQTCPTKTLRSRQTFR